MSGLRSDGPYYGGDDALSLEAGGGYQFSADSTVGNSAFRDTDAWEARRTEEPRTSDMVGLGSFSIDSGMDDGDLVHVDTQTPGAGVGFLPPRSPTDLRPRSRSDPSDTRSSSHLSSAFKGSGLLNKLGGSDDDDEFTGTFCFHCALLYVNALPGRCPTICCCVQFILFLLLAILGPTIFYPVEFETSFDSFMDTDVNSSLLRKTFENAVMRQPVNTGNSSTRRLDDAGIFYFKSIYFGYEAIPTKSTKPDGTKETEPISTIFDAMNDIRGFEQAMTGKGSWQYLCTGEQIERGIKYLGKPPPTMFPEACQGGISARLYFKPSTSAIEGEVVPINISLDGRGDPVSPQTAVSLAKGVNIDKIILPTAFEVNSNPGLFARSAFRFSLWCCPTGSSSGVKMAFKKEMDAVWKSFVVDTVLPFVEQWRKDAKRLKVYVTSPDMKDIETERTLSADSKLACGSLIFALLYVVAQTRSLVLGIGGTAIMAMSIPVGYTVFMILAGWEAMNMASLLAIFLIVGLGADVVFVYADSWRVSQHYKKTLQGRMAWTYTHAGKATFLASLSTAGSFVANLISVLKPLREFGLFMGINILAVWLLLTLMFVPLCSIDCTSAMKKKCCGSLVIPVPPDLLRTIVNFVVMVLEKGKWFFSITPLLVCSALIAWALVVVKYDSSVPNLFPKDHNQNYGADLFAKFAPTSVVYPLHFPYPTIAGDVCKENDFAASSTNCKLFWCEATPPPADDSSPPAKVDFSGQRLKNCSCYSRVNYCNQTAKTLTARMRIIGPPVSSEWLTDGISQHVRSWATPEGSGTIQASTPMQIEEWESGNIDSRILTEVTTQITRNGDFDLCSLNEICFCDTFACKPATGWNKIAPPLQPPPILTGRLLQQTSTGRQYVPVVPQTMRAEVDVVFGIVTAVPFRLAGLRDFNTAWKYQVSFQADSMWAQRNLYTFCDDLPPDMLVTAKVCWIVGFRDYILSRNERFPVPSATFADFVMEYAEQEITKDHKVGDYLWIAENEVKACYFSFQVDVSKLAAVGEALSHKQKWDDYTDSFNINVAKPQAEGAWHTSDLWVRAEGQHALLVATLGTLLIHLAIGFVLAVLFTFDFILAVIVLLNSIYAMICLVFFIVVILGFALGVIEMVAILVFIGYCFTYPLSFVNKYASNEALQSSLVTKPCSDPPGDVPATEPTIQERRNMRVKFALETLGCAAIGSGVTTMGVSIFLACCTLKIFSTLGAVIILVTYFSLSSTLVPMLSLLLTIGPGTPCYRRCKCPTASEAQEFVDNFPDYSQKKLDAVENWASNLRPPAVPKMPKVAMPKMPNIDAPKRTPKPETIPPSVPRTQGSMRPNDTVPLATRGSSPSRQPQKSSQPNGQPANSTRRESPPGPPTTFPPVPTHSTDQPPMSATHVLRSAPLDSQRVLLAAPPPVERTAAKPPDQPVRATRTISLVAEKPRATDRQACPVLAHQHLEVLPAAPVERSAVKPPDEPVPSTRMKKLPLAPQETHLAAAKPPDEPADSTRMTKVQSAPEEINYNFDDIGDDGEDTLTTGTSLIPKPLGTGDFHRAGVGSTAGLVISRPSRPRSQA